ncbi:nucleotidyltransferase family protein [Salinibacterium soli]|uniref:Nucleotidyltransferase domain-containing protein n=1 Tax=Antiquaquibacter soli TaxID=3064523 RepID=A0ABT9BRJ2_9MICO|nr:nucleotidyltransferase domain-containing protein [Protaetiibacter sp. WY-16]MDO7883559.1 nucleotidyltransferase domain-containing protein [Protaetiibacter sp. WY-16]
MTARSAEGVRLVLIRLVDQGIVERESTSQGNRFRLNIDHLAADAVVAIARQWTTFLDRLALDIERWASPPRYAAIFGSAARREMHADSDIDLFLVRPDRDRSEQWFEDVAQLEDRATRWTGNDVRTLWMTESEVSDRASEAVLTDILRDGIPVTGDRSWFARTIQKGES